MSDRQGDGFFTRLRFFCFMLVGKWNRPLLNNKYCIRSVSDPCLFWNGGWREWVEDGITVFTEQHKATYSLPLNGQWVECNKLAERATDTYENESDQIRKVVGL